MTLRILPAALADLKDIDNWTAERFGEAIASRVQDDLFTTMQLLADFPQMGRTRPDVTGRPVRFFSHWPYWIIYSMGSPLRVHRILHAVQDLPRLLR
ncbi:MAG TPA: type II toxin-antitoxin system RelE/ParE family toxin [Acidobacteriaceae bacterium]|jgi:plasmid stabilization system protein ParE|nr:type II toxin-antitoxin system RelE/ParE family toxin [Acidobacteriaceae bacterium]